MFLSRFAESPPFSAILFVTQFELIRPTFEKFGYTITSSNQTYELDCSREIFTRHLSLFLHKYVNKSFGTIPVLHIAQPFNDKNYYSEIALTFLLSYYLGMLVRYYPTHWNSLVQGWRYLLDYIK